MISLAAAYLYDKCAFLLFYLDGSNVKIQIFGYFKNYNFKIKDEWTIINYFTRRNDYATTTKSVHNDWKMTKNESL